MNNAKRQPAPTAAAGQKAIHQAAETGSLPTRYAQAILNGYYLALEVGRDGRNDHEQEALATAAALKQMLIEHGVFTA